MRGAPGRRLGVLEVGVLVHQAGEEVRHVLQRRGAGATLVQFSAQPVPCLTHKSTLHTLSTP